MMLAYSLLLTVAIFASAPWWFARMLTSDRYRVGLAQRLGRVPTALREAARGKRVIWLHAVSVGEVLATSRLIGELESELNSLNSSGKTQPAEPWLVMISTTTRTGQALARERFGAERVFYMPLDFAFAVRAYMRVLRPAALILMESELWPRLLYECRRARVPAVVVNARLSDRSFRRAMKVRALWSGVLRMPTLWLAQSEETADRLRALGVAAAAIRTTGNLKYDVRAPKQSRIAELIQQAAAGRPIVVAGSTVGGDPPEDSWLIRAFDRRPGSSAPLLVLAPRHPENFDLIYSMAVDYPTLRATELLAEKGGEEGVYVRFREGERTQVSIILLDTIGDLASVYAIADIAFVGGSLIPHGGHNPLEPAQFGIPIVMGSSFENFREIVNTMHASRAIRVVENGHELSNVLQQLLSDRETAQAMGERGRQVFESQQGATARTVEAVVSLLGVRA